MEKIHDFFMKLNFYQIIFLAFFISLTIIFFYINAYQIFFQPPETNIIKILETGKNIELFFVILTLLFIAPIFETLIFQKYIIGVLQKKKLSKRKQIFYSALLFSVFHDVPKMLCVFFVGAIIAYAYIVLLGDRMMYKRRAFWGCVFIHFLLNFVSVASYLTPRYLT